MCVSFRTAFPGSAHVNLFGPACVSFQYFIGLRDPGGVDHMINTILNTSFKRWLKSLKGTYLQYHGSGICARFPQKTLSAKYKR